MESTIIDKPRNKNETKIQKGTKRYIIARDGA